MDSIAIVVSTVQRYLTWLVSMLRKAQEVAMGAEVIQEIFLFSQHPGLFGLADELDHVALLGVALLVDERIKKAGRVAQVRNRSYIVCPSLPERRTSGAA